MPDDVLNGILDSASDDQSANSTGRTPLVIDSDLRTIKVPTDYVFGVQNDQDVLTVPFVVPRYCDGVDLSELSIRINFTTKSGLSSYYDVTDKTVNTDTIEFAWLLGAAVFVSVGDLTFAVCIRKVEADGRITKEFNTTLATAKILPGLTVEDQKDPTQYSILVQMQNLAESVNSTIEDAEEYAEQLRNYVGSPLVATAASDMTDQNRIYVYVGNENGYNNGHWYYYQSLTWHDGGTYSALPAGDYPDIYAGNVMSDRYQMDSTPYLFRPTGGGLQRIGERCYPVLVGASVAENQLAQANVPSASGIINNGDGSFTVPVGTDVYFWLNNIDLKANHVYYQDSGKGEDGKCYFRVNHENGSSMTTKATPVMWRYATNTTKTLAIRALNNTIECRIVPQLIDITAWLGSTIADYLYSLESATAGAGIAKLRSWGFLKGYSAYNAGSIESVEVTGKKCVGFNQWDEELEVGGYSNADGSKVPASNRIRSKNYIPVFPSTTYYGQYGGDGGLYAWFYDGSKKFISLANITRRTFTTPDNARYMNIATYKANSETYNHDICINLSSDRNGEYEPYSAHTYDLGTDTLRGLFKLNANNNLYADGDRKEADGTITRRYGNGTPFNEFNWNYSSSYGYWVLDTASSSVVPSIIKTPISNANAVNMITNGYTVVTRNEMYQNPNAPDKSISVATNGSIIVKDTSVTSTSYNGIKSIMDALTVVYELATPTTEQSTPFTSPQIVYPDGTEEFVTENGVPVGHVTKYPYDLKTQAERLIDIPDVPSTNGTYVLKATRSSSGLTYTWVAG